MEKKKKFKLLGFKPKELIQLGTILGAFFWGWRHFDNKFVEIDRKFDQVDRRFEKMEARFDSVESRLDNIETDLSHTRHLLSTYLTWRFIYVNDPARKDLVPIYDPLSGTETLSTLSHE